MAHKKVSMDRIVASEIFYFKGFKAVLWRGSRVVVRIKIAFALLVFLTLVTWFVNRIL